MSENTVLASCKKLHTDSEQQYYALVVTNLQQHSFDVAVTDGESAWRGTDLKVSRPPGFSEEEAWARARQLLTDVAPAAKPAVLRATQQPTGELQFVWSWEREVGAGRHVMKFPNLTAAAAAAAADQQQPPGVLLQQQPPHSTIKHVLDTLVTSYGSMQASLAVSASAQSSLASSLDVLRGQLDSQAAAHKERERELYLKFTMLLNQKTRQLQKEHDLVKQLSAEVERLKGEAEADTDDEAMQAAYAADQAAAGDGQDGRYTADALDADTEPGSNSFDGGPAAAAGGGGGGGGKQATLPALMAPDVSGVAAVLPGSTIGTTSLAGAEKPAGADSQQVVMPDSEGLDAGAGQGVAHGHAAAAGGPAAAAEGAGAAGSGAGPMDVDLAAETQLLPDSQLDVYRQELGSYY